MEKRYILGNNDDKQVINKSIDNNTSIQQEETYDTDLNTTRLEFNTQAMRKFMKDRGIKVLWERAYLCTCLDTKTGAPRVDCPRCYGSGFAYLPPVEDIMAIQSQGKGISVFDLGILETGTAIGTTQLEHRISYRDRITVPDVVIPQSMIFYLNEPRLKKGYPLLYDVREVTFIVADEQPLVENDDYYIKDNRLFVDKKYKNQNISLNILMTLRYTVTDILKESRYQYTMFNQPRTKFENLPQKLLLKREDVIVKPTPYKVNDGIEEDLEVVEANVNDPKAKPNQSTSLDGFFNGGL